MKYNKKLIRDVLGIITFDGGAVCFQVDDLKQVMNNNHVSGNPSRFVYGFIFNNTELILQKFNTIKNGNETI